MFGHKRASVGSLIQEIIAAASDRHGDLESVLLKAQVLGSRLGNAELSRWAKCEIEGYGVRDTVPPYRRIPVRLRADCIGQTFRYMVRGAQDLSLDVVPKEFREDFRSWTAAQGVSS
jgi:hypothetical protein